jgi:hypothetical protein
VRRGGVSEEDGTDFQFHFISRDWLGMPNSRFSATRNPFFFSGVILPSLEAEWGSRLWLVCQIWQLLGAILALWEDFGEIY